MKYIFIAALAIVAWNVSGADVKSSSGPGVRVIEGRITEWPIPTSLAARDPVPDAGGNIYFSVPKGDRIMRFDPQSKLFKQWSLPTNTRPHGLVVSPDGKVFFAGHGNGTIGELDPQTGAVSLFKTTDPASEPYSIVLDAQGNVWSTLRETNKVARLNRVTGVVSEYPMDGEPYGLAFDRRGILWVSRIAGDKLGGLNPQTGKTTDLYTGAGSKPRRLGLGPDGRLWVSLYGSGKLASINPATNTIVKEYALPGGPNVGPYSVNIDASGRVWVVEHQTDTIVILDTRSERFQIVRMSGKNLRIRNAAIDAQGRYWYINTTEGKLGVID